MSVIPNADARSRAATPGYMGESCAHALVRLATEALGPATRAWWACEACGAPFAPIGNGVPETPPAPVDVPSPKEYLSVRELAALIPYSEGTLRNLVSQGRLALGTHYSKPRGRVMFHWPAIQAWLKEK